MHVGRSNRLFPPPPFCIPLSPLFSPFNMALLVCNRTTFREPRRSRVQEDGHCSPYYAPIEVLLHKRHSGDHDTWSLGVVMYEVAMGRRPFRCVDKQDLIRKIQAAEYVFDSPRRAALNGAEGPPVSRLFESVRVRSFVWAPVWASVPSRVCEKYRDGESD